jgi:membrane protease subunit HflK
MEEVLRDMDKVLIDNSTDGAGVVPYLPLPDLERRMRERAAEQPGVADTPEVGGGQP